ncbi:MAG TPA: helix-turn-helix domain-containing protein [Solirubrobacteraceae bacterium]|nr:helix-turn-helix domain-containing protein [Solirubrobacteraceae bacterium]
MEKAGVEEVRRLLQEGLSQAEVARRTGRSKSTVSWHARRLDRAIDDRCARRYDWSEIQAYYDAGHSITDCQLRFGFSRQSWHEAQRRGKVRARPHAMPVDQLLSGPRNRRHVKQRLLNAGLKQNRCERCGIDEWLGAPLSMALHHVNGDGSDNRLENLQMLCPNCHSQTENFAGRNRRRGGAEAA